MIRVRKSVMEDTRNEQIPWEEAALSAPFSFSADERWLRPPGRGGNCPGPGGLKRGMTCVDAGGRTCRSFSGERNCE